MTRSELLVTLLGLLGTFLLPWPGEYDGIQTAVRRFDAPVHAVPRADEGQNCTTASPGVRRAADRRESVAVVSADRG